MTSSSELDRHDVLRELDWFGATVQGPTHRRRGEPRQDDWSGQRAADGRLIVVCDGMGSRTHSDRGARAACRSVADAVRLWSGCPAPLEHLLALVHSIWRVKIAPRCPDECATTCLFGYVEASGRTTLAQLGDGLAALHLGGDIFKVQSNDGSFGNETTGLGVTNDLEDWSWLQWESFPQGATMLLATDGVAEDLVPGQLDDVTVDLLNRYRGLNRARRARLLERELTNWKTPGHSDDKTLAMMWRDAEEPECP